VASRFHYAALIFSVILNCFIAWMLVELSKPEKTIFNQILQREIPITVQLRTTNALTALLQLKRTQASEMLIVEAFKNYEELAKQYQDQDDLSIRQS